jgi:hypothetical protein
LLQLTRATTQPIDVAGNEYKHLNKEEQLRFLGREWSIKQDLCEAPKYAVGNEEYKHLSKEEQLRVFGKEWTIKQDLCDAGANKLPLETLKFRFPLYIEDEDRTNSTFCNHYTRELCTKQCKILVVPLYAEIARFNRKKAPPDFKKTRKRAP